MTRPSTYEPRVDHVALAAPSHQRGLPGHPGPRPAPGHRSSAVARPDAGAVAPQRTRSLHGGLEALGCRRHVQAVARWPLGRLRAGLVRLMERIAERCPTRTPARARPPAPRRNRRFPFLAGLIVTSGWRTSPLLGTCSASMRLASLASVIGCRPPPPRYAGWIAEARLESKHITERVKRSPCLAQSDGHSRTESPKRPGGHRPALHHPKFPRLATLPLKVATSCHET